MTVIFTMLRGRRRVGTRLMVFALSAALTVGLLPGPGLQAAAAATDAFHLRHVHAGGAADISFTFGRLGDIPVTGDWNGDGRTTAGIVRDGVWHLRNANSGGDADISFRYGRAGDLPITGDWNGDGRDTVGIVRDGVWHLRNANAGGGADHSFRYGRAGDLPITGDWNGDRHTTIGIVRDGVWHLRNANAGGGADHSFRYGRADDLPVTGDWNRDGRETIGIARGDHFYLRNLPAGGTADHTFKFGRATDVPITGDWAGDGRATVGIVRYASSTGGATSSTTAPEPERTACEGTAWEAGDLAVVDHVVPPSGLDLAAPTGALADRARRALGSATRFALGTHFDANYAARTHQGYLDLYGGTSAAEYRVRLPSSTALSVAIALRTGAYDATQVGRSEAFASDYVVWLTRSLACQHRAITEGGWGAQWQSAFWAYLAGTAGWLSWDDLDDIDRSYVARMVEFEANRFVAEGYEVPYWKDRDGTTLFPGDSKAEENSWNANVLQLATAMMPDHPNAEAWQHRNIELMLSSYATEEDAHSDERIHGKPLSEWLNGFNIEPDGTVINHGRINPDYMTTIHQNWSAAMTYGLAGMSTPDAAFHNADLVYGALSTVQFEAPPFAAPGGTFYVDGDPRLYYPQGYSWGPNRPAPFFNIDVMAHVFGADDLAAGPAHEWAAQHGDEQLRLQARKTYGDGRTYVDPEEDKYPGREEYAAQILSTTWLAVYVTHHELWSLEQSDHAEEEPPGDDDPMAPDPPEDEGDQESP